MDRLTLVTGATGLVGNNVVRLLLEQGSPVRVLIRHDAAPQPLEGLAVEGVGGDILDPDSVRRACQGVGCVIHAAAYVQLGRGQLDLHRTINVEGTRHVATAAREAGARLVHVSSTDALGVGSLDQPADEATPLRPPVRCSYVITKREAEQVVLAEVAQGLDAVIVNPSFMLGPWDWKPSSGRMLLEVAKGRAILAPRGCFSITDVRDVAAAILAAVEKGRTGQRYILAGETMSYLAAWRLFAEVTGGRRPLAAPGPVLLWLAGRAGDFYSRLRGCESDVNSGAIALARLPKHYTSRRAIEQLGYHLRPLRQTVEDAWAWLRQHGYA
jgi:dihydroflavonol-4-reductase